MKVIPVYLMKVIPAKDPKHDNHNRLKSPIVWGTRTLALIWEQDIIGTKTNRL
jgi:hypothetical protein